MVLVRAPLFSPPIACVHIDTVQVIEVVVVVIIVIVVVAVYNIYHIQNCVDRYHCKSQKTKRIEVKNYINALVFIENLKGENVEVDGQEDDLS